MNWAWILLLVTASPLLGQGLKWSNPGPLSPREEQATFRIPSDLVIELVASEPDVIDPVAMCFDHQGRIFVCEMLGYPNAGVATGEISTGRIRLLQDKNQDGYFETSSLFAEGLRFPTGIVPFRNGVIVANAPDLIYLEDTNHDGKADTRKTLYTGFALENIQQLVNSLQWHVDNYIYACVGGTGGTIRSVEKKTMPPITLRGRGIRFKPDQPGSLEAISCGGQYGLAVNEMGHWFTATNSQHLRHIVFPEEYIKNNPQLNLREVTKDIPDHGPACKVFRISPFEAWRVERTGRRKDTNPSRYADSELVPGGFITSACSPLIYWGNQLPMQYLGNSFVCDPANNLIHRDLLVRDGSTYIAKRGDTDCEFLASTDTWFRPVQMTLAPDGSILVLDFYREVIETPLSLPEDIKKKVQLNSRGRGRIWRIRHKDATSRNYNLADANESKLKDLLQTDNPALRLLAHRRLLEKYPGSIEKLQKLLAGTPHGRIHQLWLLHETEKLTWKDVEPALSDSHESVRMHAIKLAERFLKEDESVLKALVTASKDDSHLRFQVALSLGVATSPGKEKVLAELATGADTWMQNAILSSSKSCYFPLLKELAQEASSKKPLLLSLCRMIGSQGSSAACKEVLAWLFGGNFPAPLEIEIVNSLGEGTKSLGLVLGEMIATTDSPEAKWLARLFEKTRGQLSQPNIDIKTTLGYLSLLSNAPAHSNEELWLSFLRPEVSPKLQSYVIRTIGRTKPARFHKSLITHWKSLTPLLRKDALDALLSSGANTLFLLDALENRTIPLTELDAVRLADLRKHSNKDVRDRMAKLLQVTATNRGKLLEEWKAVTELAGDSKKGQAAFQKHCAGCHRLENQGHDVGANLTSALQGKSKEYLLIAILDPNREVDPRYLSYTLEKKNGQTLVGIIATETNNSVTLKLANGKEESVLRSQIQELVSSGQSLMPEGFENQITKPEMADLLEYLRQVGGK